MCEQNEHDHEDYVAEHVKKETDAAQSRQADAIAGVDSVVHVLQPERNGVEDECGGEELHNRMEDAAARQLGSVEDVDGQANHPAHAKQQVEVVERLAVVRHLVVQAGFGLRERSGPSKVFEFVVLARSGNGIPIYLFIGKSTNQVTISGKI